MTAEEARKKIESGEILKNNSKKIEVEEKINKAIDEGLFCVYIDGIIPEGIKNYFIGLGYKIRTGGRYNEIDTVIEW